MARPASSLPGTLALLAALAAVLLLSAAGRDESAPAGVANAPGAASLDSEQLAELAIRRNDAVARRVEEIRELSFDRVPRPRLADTEYLRDLTERELSRPRVADELRADEVGLRLLGMIEPDADLGAIASDYTASAAAFYDPRKSRLFVVSDAVPAGPDLVEFVLAHELTHALEDQRFGLPQDSGRTSDEQALAESALVEGTATALMSEYAGRHLSLLGLASDASGVVEPEADLPEFLEAQATFSYFRGQEFVEQLYARTESWALVDRAYTERPPETSEQILHPVKYLLGEGALPVEPPSAPGAGWRLLDDDVIGEFLTEQILRVGDTPVPPIVTAGWGGDRYRLWARRGDTRECRPSCRADYAIGIAWRWDSASDLEEFQPALIEYVESGLHGEPSGDRVWRLDEGWARVSSDGGVVRLALAPTAELAERITAP